jgi:hypothetical protein
MAKRKSTKGQTVTYKTYTQGIIKSNGISNGIIELNDECDRHINIGTDLIPTVAIVIPSIRTMQCVYDVNF